MKNLATQQPRTLTELEQRWSLAALCDREIASLPLCEAAVKETLLLLLRSVLPSVTRVTAADAVTSASDTDGPAPGGGEAHKRTFGHAIARLVAYFTISVLITHFMPQIFAKVGL